MQRYKKLIKKIKWKGGICVVVNGLPYCACPSFWTGQFCQIGTTTTTTQSTTTTKNACAGINCLNGKKHLIKLD